MLDLKKDWKTHMKTELCSIGFLFNAFEDIDIATIRYFNIKRRILSSRVRKIYESQELQVPNQYIEGYCELKRCITTGANLKPYLSRQIKKGKKNYEPVKPDLQLNDWGITHFHFLPAGTKDILFAMVTDKEVFMLKVFSHGAGTHSNPWTNTDLIEILHRNWPEMMKVYKCKGMTGDYLTENQRTCLRKKHANALIKVSDGTTYFPPGGGMMSSGDCIHDRIKTDQLLNDLEEWELTARDNESEFRKSLNLLEHETLSLKMVFSDEGNYFYEPNKHVKFELIKKMI